jgi:PAS domain S-box-containing protein
LMGIDRDVTARKQAEVALKESRAFLDTLLNAMPVPIFYKDAQGNYLGFNKSFEQYFGKTLSELVGKSVFAIAPRELAEIYHTKDLELLQHPGKQVYETQMQDARGEAHTVVYHKATFTDSAGQVRGLIGVILDITERKRMEQALHDSEERFRTLYNNMAIGIYRTTPGGQVLLANPAMVSLLGYASFDELAARDLNEEGFNPSYPRARFLELIEKHGEVKDLESSWTRRDGSVVFVKENARAIRGPQGTTLYFDGAIEDITERKRAEEALRRLNAELEQRVEARTAELHQANEALRRALRVKDEFLMTMSHELRTPLTAILGMAELLQTETYGPLTERQAACAQAISTSGRHLLALINDVLDVAKIAAGQLKLEVGPVSVAEICQEAQHLITPQADKKQITLSLALDPAATVLQADARRLKQILVNLLGNAVKFTPASGRVGLTVFGDEKQRVVKFTVWDTGIGIAAEDVPRLFQDFVQLDARYARVYEGTGLGLALVRRLVELHGGEVWVESEGLGKGSRFTVGLPWRPSPGAGS